MLVLAFGCASPHHAAERSSGPESKANPTDVGSIDDIIRVDYGCVSGPAGLTSKVRQKKRDDTLYMPGARFVSVNEENGKTKTDLLTEDTYWAGFGTKTNHNVVEAAYETEAGRRTERYGNLADVRSVSEVRDTPTGPVTERYVNFYHLYWDGTRWWIAGIIWQRESVNAPIPASWIGKWEEVAR